ncbi:DUF1906 domain-containing protein [Schinkia azotoformans]|nr:DUF1906 domain-containing protein [Schinkia azotoformans]MED4353879.1 DUF1906 domain-containing protein [Schinkia azotoformans]MED4414063.1 DUF1906 domain-containing protein [Schinkia azotoformans]
MALGCDTATAINAARLQTLVNGGYTFVGRYLAGSYALTASEKSIITGGGLFIVSIWEKGSPTSSSYFTAAKGTSDATDAIAAAKAIGQPLGTPIYFTVDYDASTSDITGPIKNYLQAVKAVFATQNYPYELGLYGSGAVLSYYQNTFTYPWLAGSTGWSGSKTYTGYVLKQYANNTSIGSGTGQITIDKDDSNGAAGGWK